MQWNENSNITYDNVDSYLFKEIPWFLDFFYRVYDDSDRSLKYEVFWSLTDFFKENYKQNPHIVKIIIDTLSKVFVKNNPKLQELISVGFIENLVENNRKKMLQLREILKYPELQVCLDELFLFWNQERL